MAIPFDFWCLPHMRVKVSQNLAFQLDYSNHLPTRNIFCNELRKIQRFSVLHAARRPLHTKILKILKNNEVSVDFQSNKEN